MNDHKQEKARRASAPFHAALWRTREAVNRGGNPPPYLEGWGMTAHEAVLDAFHGDQEEASAYITLGKGPVQLLIKSGYTYGLLFQRKVGTIVEF